MYCKNCGMQMPDDSYACPGCGTLTAESFSSPTPAATGEKPKKRIVAGLLAIFLGFFGIHNFYLGYTTKGLIQLAVSVVLAVAFGIGPLAMWVWAIIDAIQIFNGEMRDANGNALV